MYQRSARGHENAVFDLQNLLILPMKDLVFNNLGVTEVEGMTFQTCRSETSNRVQVTSRVWCLDERPYALPNCQRESKKLIISSLSKITILIYKPIIFNILFLGYVLIRILKTSYWMFLKL